MNIFGSIFHGKVEPRKLDEVRIIPDSEYIIKVINNYGDTKYVEHSIHYAPKPAKGHQFCTHPEHAEKYHGLARAQNVRDSLLECVRKATILRVY